MWRKLAKRVIMVGGLVGTACALPLKRFRRKPRCRSTYSVKASTEVSLKVCNKCPYAIDVYWANYEGVLTAFETLKPNGVYSIRSWSTHAWCFKPSNGTALPVWKYKGPSAVLHVLPTGKLQVTPMHKQAAQQPDDGSWMRPEWGQYRERAKVAGMPIMAYDCVGDDAVSALSCCITHMTASMRPDIMERLQKAGCKLAIIGRNQTTTDIPEHHFMCQEADNGGRDVDATARGLGATPAVPTCSCGEENLTMVDDNRYYEESILVHEFAHAVMNLGFSNEDKATIRRLYKQAQQQQLYHPECYMMENADEYWAEGAQSWFDATVRTDVNSGICNRQLLQQHDPGLAELLLQVYGNSSWRYPDTCPGLLTTAQQMKQFKKQLQEQQQKQQPQSRIWEQQEQQQDALSRASEQQQQQQQQQQQPRQHAPDRAHRSRKGAGVAPRLPRRMPKNRKKMAAGNVDVSSQQLG